MLIKSKISKPTPPPKQILRAELLKKMSASGSNHLTLVTAPAGYGKSALVSQWLERELVDSCWYCIDEGDSSCEVFFSYFIRCIRGVNKTLDNKLAALESTVAGAPAMEIVGKLIAILDNYPKRFIAVLEDYHWIDSDDINKAVGFLLRHLPQAMRLIVISRKTPDFPLAKLRIAGKVGEFTVDEMRFTAEEAEDLLVLDGVANPNSAIIDEIYRRTEGWPIAIALYGMSLRNMGEREDGFVHIQNSEALTIEYLLEEVLQNQSPEMQSFLINTSLLKKFHADLCNDVLGINNSAEYIEQLVLDNIPVHPFRYEDGWFKYHQLLRQSLYGRLQALAKPLGEMHAKASRWYAEHGYSQDAMEHAFESGNIDLKLKTIEQFGLQMSVGYDAPSVRYWIRKLPPNVQGTSYMVKLIDLFATFALEDFSDFDHKLNLLETDFDQSTADFSALRKGIAQDTLSLLKIGRLHYKEDSGEIFREAEGVLDTLSPGSNFQRGGILVILGRAYIYAGAPIEALPLLSQAKNASVDGYQNVFIETIAAVVDAYRHLGRIKESEALIDDTLCLVETNQLDRTLVFARLCSRVADLEFRRNNLRSALASTEKCIKYAKNQTEIEALLRSYLLQARILIAMGKTEEAEQLMYEAKCVTAQSRSKLRESFARVILLDLNLQLGHIEEVSSWLESYVTGGAFSHAYEQETILFARWALVSGDANRALEVLDHIRPQSLARQRFDSVLTIDIIRAAGLNLTGNQEEAIKVLEDAVVFAEREGYIRPFVSFASYLYELLLVLRKSKNGVVRLYVVELLKACSLEYEHKTNSRIVKLDYGVTLTPRETEITQYIFSGMTNNEIAETVFISVSTVKTHINRIFAKLGVENRKEMIVQVKEKGLM